jgi:pyruvate, water dikinase
VDKYWLEQIQLQDYAKVGDKAFSLSRSVQLGYPVVPGFVISSTVTHEFLENLNSSEALVADLPHSSLHLDVSNWRQLQQVASLLRQEMIAATVPTEWVNAIFDAATAWGSCLIFRPTIALPSMNRDAGDISGLLESQVCQCLHNDIADALKRTWSQLFRARSLLYWQRFGIDLRQISFGILVQPLFNAIASGSLVANSSQWELKATIGLGIAINQGEVVPDFYKIQPESGTILEQKLGNKMLAYRVSDTSKDSQAYNTLLIQESSCLTTYLPDESQQHQFALSSEYIQQLIQLANQFLSEYGNKFSFQWTISTKAVGNSLALTQVTIPQPPIPDFELLLKGIGAASGRIAATARVINDSERRPEFGKNTILVASAIIPEWLPFLQNVTGIITEQGGMTSHAAILARELKIPAVVNVTGAKSLIKDGAAVLIDGDKGEIYSINNNNATIGIKKVGRFKNGIGSNTTKILQLKNVDNKTAQTPRLNEEPITWMPTYATIATRLLVNLSQYNSIEQVKNLPIDGVGLLRSELMAISLLDGQEPNTWLQEGKQTLLLKRFRERIMQFVQGFAPRPIFYRSLDIQINELHETESLQHHTVQSRYSDTQTVKPLAYRGTFGYMQNSAMFELELTALAQVQQAGYRNINLILPFVRTVEEFVFCRQKVEQAGLTTVSQFQLWIMAEVPSVLFLLPEYVKAGVQGIAIGTNDLTQLLLGVDREQGKLASSFDAQHPAVMGAIRQLIYMAKNANIPCSICGQAPALYPEIIDQLVQWGITSISVEPEAVQKTYYAIARAEQRIILETARKLGKWE